MGRLVSPWDVLLDNETAEAISNNINQQLDRYAGMSVDQVLTSFGEAFVELLPKLALALVFVVVGLFLIYTLMKVIVRMLKSSRLDPTLHNFVSSTVKIILITLLAFMCARIIGIDLTPLIAALGALGLALSLAVRDTLANVAGGISVLFSRPFTKGDYVEIGGQPGTIVDLGLVYTLLLTVDNKHVFLPNGDVAKSTIINYSAEPIRRLDVVFNVKAGSDFEGVKQAIYEIIEKFSMVLENPKPLIRISGQTFAHVQFTVMVWVERKDLLDLQSDLIGAIRTELNKNGW